MNCVRCRVREAIYDAPGRWCDFCWLAWWYEGYSDEELRACLADGEEHASRELLRREAVQLSVRQVLQ